MVLRISVMSLSSSVTFLLVFVLIPGDAIQNGAYSFPHRKPTVRYSQWKHEDDFNPVARLHSLPTQPRHIKDTFNESQNYGKSPWSSKRLYSSGRGSGHLQHPSRSSSFVNTTASRRASVPHLSRVSSRRASAVWIEETTQRRWWLDTIAKLLHSHPLRWDFHSQIHHSSAFGNEIEEPDFSYSESHLLWKRPTVAVPHGIYSRYDNGAVVGWRKPQNTAFVRDPDLRMHNWLRKRISIYRNLMSPKQWKQFFSESLPGSRDERFNLALFEAAVIGVRRAVAECRYQFRMERWNCSQIPNEESVLFGNILLKGIPQTAFVHSIINAGIVQSVAEACLGQIEDCPCNNHGRESSSSNWQWQGCDHNIHYGRKFSRRLLDSMEKGSHIRFQMNLHNNKVGRTIVTRNMERYCRCHGTSGSCSLRTCYRRTPRMRTLGNLLKQMYDQNLLMISPELSTRAKDMKLNPSRRTHKRRSSIRDDGLRFADVGNRYPYSLKTGTVSTWNNYPGNLQFSGWSRSNVKWQNVDNNGRLNETPTTSLHLVYYENVPQETFCEANPKLHILGTHGRTCNSTSEGPDNCKSLCCGRGFVTRHYYAMESCHCKFIWCCRVECQQCLALNKVETCF